LFTSDSILTQPASGSFFAHFNLYTYKHCRYRLTRASMKSAGIADCSVATSWLKRVEENAVREHLRPCNWLSAVCDDRWYTVVFKLPLRCQDRILEPFVSFSAVKPGRKDYRSCCSRCKSLSPGKGRFRAAIAAALHFLL
jgi:hypothetical protein